MKTLYLDLFSGISGDMFLGAMIDLGVEFPRLEEALGKLGLAGFHLHAARKQKANIEGVKFDVHLAHASMHPHGPESHHHPHESKSSPHAHGHSHHHGDHDHDHDHHHHSQADGHAEESSHGHEDSRDFAEIKRLINASGLSAWVKQKSVAVFHRVAVAEGKIHGHSPDEVHFHEVGAIDSIVDIVGACVALELLGKPTVLASPVVEGTGWIQCAHGRFPIPAPATLEILRARNIALSQCEEPHELVTPTGAALLAELVENFGPMRDLAVEKIGYGLGTRDNRTRPNVLRAILGETRSAASTPSPSHDWETDTICVLETNLDDINSEILGHFMERAFAAGALDVFHTPIQMKKNRPGVLLTILCRSTEADAFAESILRETGAFGVRRHAAERRKLRREWKKVSTPFGEASVKLGTLDGRILHATPEFESCKTLAEKAGVPLKEVYEAVNRRSAELHSAVSPTGSRPDVQ